MVRELQDFRIDFTAAGHLTFNARSGKHDDLVLALAIAVWRAYGGGIASWGFYELMRRQTTCLTASDPCYYVGVDLGQSRDPTAIAVVRRFEAARSVGPNRMAVLHARINLRPAPGAAITVVSATR